LHAKLFTIFLAIAIVVSCSTQPTSPDTGNNAISKTAAARGRICWGQWHIFINPEDGAAAVSQIRGEQSHVNVTWFLQPPKCADCLQVLVDAWDPVERVADITVVLKNRTQFTGYDVKTVLSDYDLKEFLEPDAWCDFYTDGSTWQPYYLFAENEQDHAFEPDKTHARGIRVHLPVGATGKATLTVDASWPDPQEEPWRIDNIIVSGPLQNDWYHHIAFTCHVRDTQDDVTWVYADLTPVGPEYISLGDDGNHTDYQPDDAIWGADTIMTTAAPGVYDAWIRAKSDGSDRFTYQKFQIEVIYPVSPPPPLYVVSMMHAEEQPFFLDEQTYLKYATDLRNLMDVFDSHGAKIALGPDWTFIQGTMSFDPTLFSDFQTHGHGVDTHAHETQYDLGQVHDMLDAAGVQDTIIGNGGFTKTWDDQNWAAYVSHFTDQGGDQMFLAAVAFKDPVTQVVDSLYTPIRPSFAGDWMVHDPEGPLVYIPGAPSKSKPAPGPAFFDWLMSAVDYAVAGAVPGKINCCYWHDSVHNYDGSSPAQFRIATWEAVLSDYFDDKVADGLIVWANFSEMYQLYIDWEEDNGD
jgi:hypothetical protein